MPVFAVHIILNELPLNPIAIVVHVISGQHSGKSEGDAEIRARISAPLRVDCEYPIPMLFDLPDHETLYKALSNGNSPPFTGKSTIMNQIEKAQLLKTLHVPGTPLVLYNIWDAGGAIAIAKAGAKAIATGSWSVAESHGFRDGESIPLDLVLVIVERISKSVDLPLTVDFEGGYAALPDQIEVNVNRLIEAGAVGLNFEDQIINGSGLYPISEQVKRIKAVRNAADNAGVPMFLNARTDLFLKQKNAEQHAALLEEALLRQSAFADAGADGFFVPGLTDKDIINTLCSQSQLPVNVMMRGELNSIEDASQYGVSRISFGPGPYIDAIDDLTARFSNF